MCTSLSLSLFILMCYFTEPAHQNSGKASILGDATRILRDLFAQVECLRKENAALVTESHYVSILYCAFSRSTFLLSTV